MASVKLGKTSLETVRWETTYGDLGDHVFYNGVDLGWLRLQNWGNGALYVARVNTKDGYDSTLVGYFYVANYKSYHACRKAAAEAIVVAHDKLLDGEPL